MAPNKNLRQIALIYRIYFLYIEPTLTLGGIYLPVFSPTRFLVGTVPSPAISAVAPLTITPITQLLLTNIAALYALFSFNEAVVLRLTSEKKVWLAIMLGMLLSDLGHVYAVWRIAPDRMAQVASWNSDEWINYGTLLGGTALRIAFLAGVGNR